MLYKVKILLEECWNVTIIALGFHPILGAMIGLEDRGNHMKDLLAGVKNSKPCSYFPKQSSAVRVLTVLVKGPWKVNRHVDAAGEHFSL